MSASDWKIGDEFTTYEGLHRWRVTDVGSRVVVAVKLDLTKPWALETVFDEDEQPSMKKVAG